LSWEAFSAVILTTSFLVNDFRANHLGLSRFTPLDTMLDERNSAYLFTLKDQHFCSGNFPDRPEQALSLRIVS
jgi:hypothetical protein